MKNPFMAAFVVAFTFTMPQPAAAQGDVDSNYIGFDVGIAAYDDFCSNSNLQPCDKTDTSPSIYSGWNFHENFAVEGGYVDFGGGTFTSTNRNIGTYTYESWALYIAGVGKIRVGERVSIIGKFGIHRWEFTTSLGRKTDGFGLHDLMLGVGAEVSLSQNGRIKLRTEYQHWTLDDVWDNDREYGFKRHVVGLTYTF